MRPETRRAPRFSMLRRERAGGDARGVDSGFARRSARDGLSHRGSPRKGRFQKRYECLRGIGDGHVFVHDFVARNGFAVKGSVDRIVRIQHRTLDLKGCERGLCCGEGEDSTLYCRIRGEVRSMRLRESIALSGS
jgi:hypothetical protein